MNDKAKETHDNIYDYSELIELINKSRDAAEHHDREKFIELQTELLKEYSSPLAAYNLAIMNISIGKFDESVPYLEFAISNNEPNYIFFSSLYAYAKVLEITDSEKYEMSLKYIILALESYKNLGSSYENLSVYLDDLYKMRENLEINK